MGKLLLFLWFVLPSIWACEKDAEIPADTTVTEGDNAEFNVNRNVMLQLVNEVRQKGCNCGGTNMPPVAPVSWNVQLARAAYKHSTDMQQKKYFSHTSPTGTNPGDRIKAEGYNWRTYGENIAFNYSDEKAVIDGWLQSVNHCKTIMSAHYKEMGVGRSGQYWTQEFGAK